MDHTDQLSVQRGKENWRRGRDFGEVKGPEKRDIRVVSGVQAFGEMRRGAGLVSKKGVVWSSALKTGGD